MRNACLLLNCKKNYYNSYGYRKCANNLRSVIIVSMLFFSYILTFDISFIAYVFLSFFFSTFQTFPNPPLPIAYKYVKEVLLSFSYIS